MKNEATDPLDEVENLEPTPEEIASRNEIADILLDVAWRDFTTSADDKRSLDTKANMILVASGILLGLIINGNQIMDTSVSLLAGCFLILSCIFCIRALGIRSYSALGTIKTWNALKEKNLLEKPLNAKLNIMATLDKAIDNNRIQSSDIVAMIRPANYLFIAALFTISIAVILHYSSIVISIPIIK